MNDKDIDNASRFERYQLLNNIYCKIYNYNLVSFGIHDKGKFSHFQNIYPVVKNLKK